MGWNGTEQLAVRSDSTKSEQARDPLGYRIAGNQIQHSRKKEDTLKTRFMVFRCFGMSGYNHRIDVGWFGFLPLLKVFPISEISLRCSALLTTIIKF